MITYLFENNHLAGKEIIDWVSSFDPKYKEIDTQVRDYMRRDDFWTFAMLIDPKLERIVSSSDFETQMPFEACVAHNKKLDLGLEYSQFEYFSWMIYEAVRFRNYNKMQKLYIELNYYSEDFLSDLKDGKWGEETQVWLKLLLRQMPESVQINIYKEFELQYELKTEEDLKLD